MSRPFPQDPFLQGNYAPWPMEGEIHDLVVKGAIPPELNGTLYRNGPNPQFAPRGRYHWFDGDGMIHALTLSEGRAHYRNRWVRTERFTLERQHGEALFAGLSDLSNTDERAQGVFPNAANTNIIFHAGRLLALWEGGPPYELDPSTLDTIGLYDFNGKLQSAMTAHPKVDPETGELLFFGYGPFPPYVRYAVASADGAMTRSEEIHVPVPTMMHDFIVTQEHVIFLCFPATLRPENLTSGSPIRWEPELGTRIGVMPRDGGSTDIVWFETGPCFVFHAMNAYTQGNTVIADVCQFRSLPLFHIDEENQQTNIPVLTRWSLDLASHSITMEQRDDQFSEFPRLDERYAGLPYRMGYAAGQGGASPLSDGPFNTVVQYDHANGQSHIHAFGPNNYSSEPIFVPRSAQSAEGEGFLLVDVYRKEENRSDVVILDAENLANEPLATVQLPHRVPYGFHGNWVEGLSVE